MRAAVFFPKETGNQWRMVSQKQIHIGVCVCVCVSVPSFCKNRWEMVKREAVRSIFYVHNHVICDDSLNPFYFFCLHYALARTSSLMLNSGNNRDNSKGKLSIFYHQIYLFLSVFF